MTSAEVLQQDWDGYLTLLRRALRDLPDNNVKTRRAVYNHAEKTQKQLFDEDEGETDAEDLDYHHRLLRTTIRILENDIRADVDVFADSYAPPDLREAANKLAEARDLRRSRKRNAAAREARLVEGGVQEDYLSRASRQDLELIAHLSNGLFLADPARGKNGRGTRVAGAIGVIRAILIVQFQLIASESRFGILWMLIQPAVLLTLISLVYFILQTQFIMNMDVPTFALVGSTTWIMCRQVIFRVSTAIAHNRVFINLPPVRPIHQALAYAIQYLIIYAVVFVILLTCGRLVNMITLPADVPKVVSYVIAMWSFGFAIGLIFGSIAVHWPFFLRLASVLERALQLFSSVFFVTEQLPEEYRGYVLWSPTAHGMQLLRAAYFPGYASSDANPTYFFLCLIAVVSVGLLAERHARPRIQPV